MRFGRIYGYVFYVAIADADNLAGRGTGAFGQVPCHELVG